jgi:hypothetical protein
MRISSSFPASFLPACVLALGLVACGSDDAAKPAQQKLDLLDPAAAHYGKTYGEWAGAWVQYIGNVAPPECTSPITDPTGAGCQLYQDPEAPVFMLAGNYGGVSLRDECVVPAGKALFFPLINIYGDNAGTPAELTLSDADLQKFVEDNIAGVLPESLELSVDGQSIAHPERGLVPTTPYTLTFTAGANAYTCAGVDGVDGEFPGYVGGYWAMLAPLSSGAHTLAFGGAASDGVQGQATTIDVTYDLTVE